eukprot:Skav203776  [mRNA]  locus=scaffold206:264365:269153:+ [translate_table: standard]
MAQFSLAVLAQLLLQGASPTPGVEESLSDAFPDKVYPGYNDAGWLLPEEVCAEHPQADATKARQLTARFGSDAVRCLQPTASLLHRGQEPHRLQHLGLPQWLAMGSALQRVTVPTRVRGFRWVSDGQGKLFWRKKAP